MTNLNVTFEEKIVLHQRVWIFFAQVLLNCLRIDIPSWTGNMYTFSSRYCPTDTFCFLALYIPLTPFSVNTTYKLVPLKIIFKPKILQSSSMLNIYFISTFICIFHSYLTLKNKKSLLKTKILHKQETKTAIKHYILIIKENEKYFKKY